MKYLKTKVLYALGMYGGAILAHWLLWFIYEKLQFSFFVLAFTPLILCMLYHFSLIDCGKDKTVSKGFATLFMVILPLITFGAITIILFINNPNISLFNTATEYNATLNESMTLLIGRMTASSLYIAIFAIFEHIYLHFKR